MKLLGQNNESISSRKSSMNSNVVMQKTSYTEFKKDVNDEAFLFKVNASKPLVA